MRIRSSPGGYGNCVYLEGTDGRLYVHAHLERFAPRIAAQLPRAVHPLGGDFEEGTMEVFPSDPPAFGADEILGWSGESGAGKPHLHFEVRRGDRPLNLWREGILPAPKNTRIRIDRVSVEPAAPGGAARLLVQTVEETANGDRMSPWEIRAEVRDVASGRVVARRVLRFDAFDYGPDRDHGFAYDLARSGYRPTTYTFDLTGPTGGAGVIAEGGPLALAPAGEYEAEVVATGNGGGTARSVFRFSSPLPPGTQWADRAGVLLDGTRTPYPAPLRMIETPAGPGWISRVAPGGIVLAPLLMDPIGARLAVSAASAAPLASGLGVAVRPDPTIRAPQEARADPLERMPVAMRFEPDGLFFAAAARVEIASDESDTRAALYRLDARTGEWIWSGREKNGFWFAGSTRRLAAFAVWVDRVAPRLVRATGRNGRPRLYFRDDLSGLASVEVRDEAGAIVRGRIDPDYDAFVADAPAPRRRARAKDPRYFWIARDRAGNVRRGAW